MTDKETAIDVIQKLPNEASLRDIAEQIEFLAAIREGEDAADRGRVITLEKLEENLGGWLSKS